MCSFLAISLSNSVIVIWPGTSSEGARGSTCCPAPFICCLFFSASAQDHCPTQRLLYEHRSPINEIKVSISQLQHNNSEGRHLEAERTSAKFISSGPGAARLAHVTLRPGSLNKGPSALPNVIFPWISFLINNFLSWVCFSGAGYALFLSPIWLGRIL